MCSSVTDDKRYKVGQSKEGELVKFWDSQRRFQVPLLTLKL